MAEDFEVSSRVGAQPHCPAPSHPSLHSVPRTACASLPQPSRLCMPDPSLLCERVPLRCSRVCGGPPACVRPPTCRAPCRLLSAPCLQHPDAPRPIWLPSPQLTAIVRCVARRWTRRHARRQRGQRRDARENRDGVARTTGRLHRLLHVRALRRCWGSAEVRPRALPRRRCGDCSAVGRASLC